MRQLLLDTETTGMDPKEGHRIIEIGVVEMIGRKLTGQHFHVYLNPEREIDIEATQVHGMTWEGLKDQPLFADIADDFIRFVDGAELLIHNAPFDVGFLDAELGWLNQRLGEARYQRISDYCQIFDTLAYARRRHPGQRNSLDALCKRYQVDNTGRTLHGALLDSEILADVYLAMTGGQTSLSLDGESDELSGASNNQQRRLVARDGLALRVIQASEAELAAHHAKLDALAASAGQCLWQSLEQPSPQDSGNDDVASVSG